MLGMLDNAEELKEIFEKSGIPFVFISVDDPVFHINRPNIASKGSVYTWIDRNHVKLFDRFKNIYPNVRNEFLPHGGEPEAFSLCGTDTAGRSIDVLVSGTISEHYNEAYAFKDINDSSVSEVCALCMQNSSYTIEYASERVLSKNGSVANDTLYEFLRVYGRCIYKYLWAKRRYLAVEKALESGADITCYGLGWENTDFIRHPNFKYLGSKNYDEQLAIFNNAKIILNIMCVKKDGTHERIFSSMLNGALCITDYSNYLAEEFKDGENIVFYDFDNIGALPLIINDLLNNAARREQIAANGFNAAKGRHTWHNRAQRILEMLKKSGKHYA
jgi:glycosyltransferase involved in cell wall biosynthesis